MELVKTYENIIELKNIRIEKEIREAAALRALLDGVLSGTVSHKEAEKILRNI